MNEKQFDEITSKLDKIYAVLAIQNISDRDDKIYALKKFGFTYTEIGPLVSMKDVRKTDGWKKK